MKSTRRVHVGTVGIDAGMLYLGDPCYVSSTPLGQTADDPDDKHWRAFLDPLGEFETAATVLGTMPNGQTRFPAGMVVTTGYGDGEYDVFVTMKDGRVASVEVVFIRD
jgi:hypothetical protein